MAPLTPALPWPEKWAALVKIWPILAIFLVVFGGIYGGIFSPTEGAGVGAVLTLLVGLFKKDLKLSGLQTALLSTAETTALEALGHQLKSTGRQYGNQQVLLWRKKRGKVEVASDPRGIGTAVATPVVPQ